MTLKIEGKVRVLRFRGFMWALYDERDRIVATSDKPDYLQQIEEVWNQRIEIESPAISDAMQEPAEEAHEEADAEPEAPPEPAPKPLPEVMPPTLAECPHCEWKGKPRGLAMHIAKKHAEVNDE